MSKVYTSELVEKIDQEVTLQGWVANRRDLGKLIFIDLRDSTGIVQVVCDSSASELRNEYVVEVVGNVKPRQLKEGDGENLPVEVKAISVQIISSSTTPPFPLTDEGYEIDDTLRSKYRYLDLRRPRLQRNLKFRDALVKEVRQFLHSKGFVEIETPLLSKTTPEGSRDFVVPSRLKPGNFYALPQSPQQYKQLLMVAGFERYFQIAHCLRDEDLRADRSFEHTQIDMEMSFVQKEDVMKLIEEMVIKAVTSLNGNLRSGPFPRFSYKNALKEFGADKFDLRSDEEKERNELAFAWVTDFPLFEKRESGDWTFSHNPFSAPLPEDREKLMAGDVENVVSTQYDLVCNGFEVGGGSIRSHEPVVLKKVLEIIGHTPEEIERDFGHMLEALSFGCPPHGGIALGLERLVALMLGEENIREVQAFPLSYTGKTAVMQAPSPLTPEQLGDFGLSLKK